MYDTVFCSPEFDRHTTAFHSSPVIASLIRNSLSLLSYWLWRRHSKPPHRSSCKETSSTASDQPNSDRSLWSYPLYFYRTPVSCSDPLDRIQGTGAEKYYDLESHGTCICFFLKAISVCFAYRIFSGFIGPADTDFPPLSMSSFKHTASLTWDRLK